jgi:hypothetical protein
MPFVEIAGIGAIDSSHYCTQVSICRTNEHMVMIGHKRPGITTALRAEYILSQNIEKHFSVE